MKKKFVIKNNTFEISELDVKNINYNYIRSLNSKNDFIVNKKTTILEQIDYVKNIKKTKNLILQITSNKVLVATAGFQVRPGRTFQGIFIINNKFRKKGFSKYFIIFSSLFVYKLKNIKSFFAGIEKKNFISFRAFLGAGFKVKKKLVKSLILNLKIDNKFKTKNTFVK